MSEVPVTHIFYCAWLKTQVETCVTGTLDMSQAPLRHKWKPGFNNVSEHCQWSGIGGLRCVVVLMKASCDCGECS